MKRKNLNLLISSLFVFVGTTEIVRAQSLPQLHQNRAEQLGGAIAYDNNSLGQITNVSQLRDVAPGDWAYEALQGLVERYGCIAGYPNGTFKGKQPLNRYEFAAGLNACLQQIERLVASNQSVLGEDLAKIQKLSEEFQAELATLGSKVDNLESRTAFLEDHQFSTTTILNGEVIFGVA
ncbi:MAG: iron uptake porin, partial [Xenococcaceae cyanobacterium]